MICYRDMTFCPYHEDCAEAKNCSRPLTEDVRERADRIGLPIAQFQVKPGCWEQKPTPTEPTP